MRILPVLTVLALLTSACFAIPTVSVLTPSSDNPQHTSAVSVWNTTSELMVGMTIKATFNDSSTETVAWATLPSGSPETTSGGTQSYGAHGTNWSLVVHSDNDTGSYGIGWWFLNSSVQIKSLLFDGGPGKTMFDIVKSPVDSPDSSTGMPFTYKDISSSAFNTFSGAIDVLYSGPVSVGSPSTFYSDLYRYMDVQFPDTFTGKLTFNADTDNSVNADITPVTPEPNTPVNPPNNPPTTVPVPGALLLASLGALGAVWSRRKRA